MENLRQEFLRKGFVRVPASLFCLDSNTLDDLRCEFGRLFDGEYATGVYPDEIHWRRGISKEDVTRELCNAWKASPMVRKVVCAECLGVLACGLMGWKASRLGQDDVIHKPPLSSAGIGFHQDGTYISDNFLPREDNCLTLWIALDDADEKNGALQYAPGSHLWRNAKNIGNGNGENDVHVNVSAASFHIGDDNHNENINKKGIGNGIANVDSTKHTTSHFVSLRTAAHVAGLDPDTVISSVETASVPAGEMLIHHQRVWHGSGPNVTSSRPRRALVAHLIDGEVRWRAHPKPHYIYGRYCIRGEDWLRDDFFPVTHSTGGTSTTLVRTSWLDD